MRHPLYFLATVVLCTSIFASCNGVMKDRPLKPQRATEKSSAASSAGRIEPGSELTTPDGGGAAYKCGDSTQNTGVFVCKKQPNSDVGSCFTACLDFAPRALAMASPEGSADPTQTHGTTPSQSPEATESPTEAESTSSILTPPPVSIESEPASSPATPEPSQGCACATGSHDSEAAKDPRNKAPPGSPWESCPAFKMPYSKKFDCDDFALSFDWYCENKLGIDCYQIGFTGSKKGTSHAFNVVEKGPRVTSYVLWSKTTYCAVEPQSNKELTCWQANVGEWTPPKEDKDKIIETFNKDWDEKFCAKAWQYWDDCHDPGAGEPCFTTSPRQSYLWTQITGCSLPDFKK